MAIIGLGEQAVREISDRAEITDAIYRYAAGPDIGDAAPIWCRQRRNSIRWC